MENIHNAEFEQEKNQLAPISALAQMNHLTIADTIVKEVKEGNVEPLKIHTFLKRVEKIVELVKEDKDVKEAIMTDAAKYQKDGKSFEYMGASMRIGPTYTFTDYSTCNDPLWDNLNEIEETVKKMKKERETFLKNAFPETNSLFGTPNPRVIVEQLFTLTPADCGEEIVLSKPVKKQTTGVVITFPK